MTRQEAMASPIPFNRPLIVGREIDYLAEVVASGRIAADGPFSARCAALLEQTYGITKILMVPSCTAALEMAAMLCGLGPGDEVLLPSYTFVSTASAIVRTGAHPVFVDIRDDTLNLDERLLEAALSPRTRAVFPVHYAGVGCAMDDILAIANRHGLLVVEDAAQAVHATYRGRALGSIGHLGAYSFHDTKNYVCGEGGALCINDPQFAERAEILRDKGTNRSRFVRGLVDKYTWVDVGSSYVASELVCAFLLAQLEARDEIAIRRQRVHENYRRLLKPLADAGHLTLPTIPPDCRSNHHMFYVLLESGAVRDRLLEHLKQRGIGAVFHYVPLHASPMGLRLGYRAGQLPVTEGVSQRLLRLPFYCELGEQDQQRVADAIGEFFGQASAVRQAA
jgi:dTDP-4-amino-4,6-dideoxygalactose transaminase